MLCAVSAKEQTSINVEEMVRNFVATRPRRPSSGRVIAGVAAGIGRRYAIDPVIVRVALLVSAVYGGAGLIAYLLGWLFLAAEEDEVSPVEALLGRGRSCTSKGLTVVLCVLLIPAASGFLFGGHFSTVAGVVVLSAGLFLLHRHRGELGQVDGRPTAPANADPEAAGGTDPSTRSGPRDTGPQDAVPPEYRHQPPAWDPLGAAPFAWDLPDPTPTPPPSPPPAPIRRHRSRLALATLGLLLVTGAALAALAPTVSWLTVPHIIGILGGITGVALIAGAFTRAGGRLIPLAMLLSVAGVGLTAGHFDGWHGIGAQTYVPTASSDVRPVYQSSVGHLTVDLANLPADANVTTKAELSVGQLTVIVPDDATVHVTCATNVGQVTCLGDVASGPSHPTLTADQAGSGPTINLTAQDGTGQVTVVDASQANYLPAVPERGHR